VAEYRKLLYQHTDTPYVDDPELDRLSHTCGIRYETHASILVLGFSLFFEIILSARDAAQSETAFFLLQQHTISSSIAPILEATLLESYKC